MIVTISLEDWRDLLFKHLVKSGKANRPLLLYTDSEILGEISGLSPIDAQKSFSQAFLKHYQNGILDTPFENAIAEALEWPNSDNFKSGDSPEILPLLVLCVISVTDQSPSPGQSVYSLLHKLMGVNEKLGKPAGYESMPQIWENWNSWLRTFGSKFGKPSARVIGHYALQGFARSQGFIRRRERVLLTDFFSDCDLDPEAIYHENYLLSMFKSWLRNQGRRSLVFYEKIFESGDSSTEEIFKEILQHEFDNWDGLTENELGSASLMGYLAKSDFGNEWEIICAVQKQLIGLDIDLGEGPTKIEESWPYVSVEQVSQKSLPGILAKGTTLNLSPELTIKAGRRSHFLFNYRKFGYDGMVEERNPQLMVTYLLLVEEKSLESMCEALAAHAAIFSDPTYLEDLRYFQFDNVVFTKTKPIDEIKLKFNFVVSSPPDLVLKGGLRVGRDQYEDKYPPYLVLPFGDPQDLYLNNHKIDISGDGAAVRFSQDLLKEGLNEVTYGASKVHFHLLESRKIKPTSSSTGYPLVKIGAEVRIGTLPTLLETSDFQVRGALFPRSPIPENSKYLQLPYEFSYIFLLTEGDSLQQILLTESFFRRTLEISESRLNLELLLNTFKGQGALLIKEASKKNCTVFSFLGTGSEESDKPRLVTRSANKAAETLLSCKWEFPYRATPINETALRLKLQKLRSSLAQTSMQSNADYFNRFQKLNESQVLYGPMDFLLEWISEQEDASVSFESFEEAWYTVGAESFHRHWRDSAIYLEELGHVELDYSRKKVFAHPATANVLLDENDCAILVGSRPYMMQQLLLGEVNTSVGNITFENSQIELELRYQPFDKKEQPKTPLGPAVAILRSSKFFDNETQLALKDFGVDTCFNAGGRYLQFTPRISEVIFLKRKYDVSLSRKFERLTGIGLEEEKVGDRWLGVGTDSDPGIYRYIQTGSIKPIAVRLESNGPLYELDLNWARYLFLAKFEVLRGILPKIYRSERIPSLTELPAEKVLFVPIGIPLPRVISRGLILASGIPVERYPAGYLYRNIGRTISSELMRILEVQRVDDDDSDPGLRSATLAAFQRKIRGYGKST